MLSAIETLDTVHMRLVSLAIIDAVLVLCEQIIVFILGEVWEINMSEK